MQDYDVVKHEYLQNNERFADFMNGANFNGRQVISPEDLASWDNRETKISKQRTGRKENKRDYGARYRDLIRKSAMGMNFVLLGIENQSHIHYAMPIRNLAYDSWNYDSQLRQIQYQHKKNKDLQGAEFLSGFSKEDLLKPVVTWVLYWGTEPWDAATDLHGLLDFTDIPDDLKDRVNNYKLNILDVRHFEHLEYFKTDIQQVFGFIQRSNDKKELASYVESHADIFSNLPEDAYDVIAVMTHSEELAELKESKKVDGRKGVSMCKAIKDMMEDSKLEGKLEGEIEGKINERAGIVFSIRRKFQKNLSVSDAADALERKESEIRQVYDLISQNPDYTDLQIAEILIKD